MDTQQIDVMVADASHEVYVDTILETIRNAAKVRACQWPPWVSGSCTWKSQASSSGRA